MRTPVVLVLASVLSIAPSALVAQDRELGPPRNRPLIGLIDRFIEDPFEVRIGLAVMDSGDARHDVTMVLSKGIMPWKCYADTVQTVLALDGLLHMLYVAGNMRAQLVNERNGNRPREGLIAVLQGYAAIHSRFPWYAVPEVDVWARTPRERLSALADSLAAAPDSCSPGQRRVRFVPAGDGGTPPERR